MQHTKNFHDNTSYDKTNNIDNNQLKRKKVIYFFFLPDLLAAIEPTFLPGGAFLDTDFGLPGFLSRPPPKG